MRLRFGQPRSQGFSRTNSKGKSPGNEVEIWGAYFREGLIFFFRGGGGLLLEFYGS